MGTYFFVIERLSRNGIISKIEQLVYLNCTKSYVRNSILNHVCHQCCNADMYVVLSQTLLSAARCVSSDLYAAAPPPPGLSLCLFISAVTVTARWSGHCGIINMSDLPGGYTSLLS
jgi:hypothetical protein